MLGYAADDPRRVTAKRATAEAAGRGALEAYCQPCVSPVWDTALAALAMQEAGDARRIRGVERALDWLQCPSSCSTNPRDWQVQNARSCAGGGWAFQFANSHYPDLDDTAVVAWAMHQARDPERYAESMRRALDWLVGMQSATAASPPSMPTTPTTTSIDSVRRSRRAAGSAHQRRHRARGDGAGPQSGVRRTRRPWSAPSPTCAREQEPTAPGSAAGAPTTSTAPGRC